MSLYPQFCTEEVMRHECHQCGRSYKWRSSLKSHLQNECGKEPRFLCPHCPYRCKVRSNLFKHLRNYHKTYIAPLKKEWRRQQIPDMLSSMIPPAQPVPYNLSKVEKIESSPLISSYNTSHYNNNNETAYNLSSKPAEKIESSPLISSYDTAYNLSSKPEKIESSPLIASYTGTGHTNTVTTGAAGFSSPSSAGGSFSSPSSAGGYPMNSPAHSYGGPISPASSMPDSPPTKNGVPSPPPYQSSPSPSN